MELYTITQLGSLFSPETSAALGINNSGIIVGWIENPVSPFPIYAVRWDNEIPTQLSFLPGGTNANAYGINNSGQIVGSSTATGGYRRACVWSGTTPTALDNPGSGNHAYGYGINQNGQSIGSYATTAIRWDGTIDTSLNPYYNMCVARGINDSAVICGYSYNNSSAPYPVVWNGITPSLLTLPPGQIHGQAFGINNLGQIVGWTESSTYGNHNAVIWNAGVPTILPFVGTYNEARAITDSSIIVGSSTYGGTSRYRGVYWDYATDPLGLPIVLPKLSTTLTYPRDGSWGICGTTIVGQSDDNNLSPRYHAVVWRQPGGVGGAGWGISLNIGDGWG
jgi:probable HAF family extracellular repeat protein